MHKTVQGWKGKPALTGRENRDNPSSGHASNQLPAPVFINREVRRNDNGAGFIGRGWKGSNVIVQLMAWRDDYLEGITYLPKLRFGRRIILEYDYWRVILWKEPIAFQVIDDLGIQKPPHHQGSLRTIRPH
jgi:hypothetical protein